jgi:hypothetical protein
MCPPSVTHVSARRDPSHRPPYGRNNIRHGIRSVLGHKAPALPGVGKLPALAFGIIFRIPALHGFQNSSGRYGGMGALANFKAVNRAGKIG